MKLTSKILTVAAIVLAFPTFASAATMSVSPQSQTVGVGETFTVTVRLDTQGASIDGVDIRHLSFDPKLLQVIDSNPSQPGIQIGADSLMSSTLLNSVDNATGKITFSQVVAMGSKYKGSGILATIQFIAKAPGNASLVFSFTPKSTKDTNVAANVGEDILSAVINGAYTITGKATAPVKNTTTPTQTQTITKKTNTNKNTVPEISDTSIPDSDTTPFEFSEKRSFWQIIGEVVRNFFGGFKNRIGSIFS